MGIYWKHLEFSVTAWNGFSGVPFQEPGTKLNVNLCVTNLRVKIKKKQSCAIKVCFTSNQKNNLVVLSFRVELPRSSI